MMIKYDDTYATESIDYLYHLIFALTPFFDKEELQCLLTKTLEALEEKNDY